MLRLPNISLNRTTALLTPVQMAAAAQGPSGSAAPSAPRPFGHTAAGQLENVRPRRIMNLRQRFSRFWDQLARSTPVIGIAASLLMMPARLQREAEEDAAYRAAMRGFGAEPLFPNDSVRQEKELIAGELVAHVAALAVGFVLWITHPVPRRVFFATWAVAFLFDYIGRKMAAWNFKRRQPDTDKMIESSLKNLGNEPGDD